jgi:hypothetical protein
MMNVVALQGAAVPGGASVFYLQINGSVFSGAKDVEVRVEGAVAEYVQTAMQPGLLCIVKGRYVPDENCVAAEAVSFLRDKRGYGEELWK